MDELITIDINGNQHMLGFKPLSQDLYETIEPYMGHDFARYVQDKVEDLQEKIKYVDIDEAMYEIKEHNK